jgi:demethylmenaquinone methyltransferase/2-methoxy-6-polyprenyl-1,4-benzoquinol methylase
MNLPNSSPVDKSPERIRRMFGAIAARYDWINHILSFGRHHSWRKRTARQLINGQTIEGDILDVCSGTGDLSLAFVKQQKKCDSERNNFGIDFSQEMVEIAQKKAKCCPALQFSVGDALNLPFEENRFAVVAVAFGLRNVCDPQQGLAEMVRVCKPGGMVAVLDFSMPTLPILRSCYWFYFSAVLPRIGQWITNNQDQAYNYFTESVFQFDRPEQLAERLRQLGIVDVQTKPMTLGVVTLTWGRKPICT